MAIDPQQPIPLYFQLKTLLLEEILSGHYGGADDRLPTEHELCERYQLSRTPVTRALSELADEGVILRHRRRGSFVNPHWLSRRPDQPEVRVIVPTEGPWARMVRDAAGTRDQISVVKVPRQSLHQTLTHAVAEGQAPDLAVIDSVWAPEFAAAGFIHALEELSEDWVRQEHEVDFLEPLVRANRYEGKTFGVSAFADASGLWYSRRKLESVDLAPPTTWAELRTAGQALAADGVRTPMVMPGGGIAGETTTYCLIAVLASNGAHVLEPAGVTLSSRATAQALRFLRRLVEERIVPSEVVGYEWDHAVRLLAEGRAALSLGGIYEAQTLAEALGVHHHDVWDHFGFTRVPGRAQGITGERRGRDDVRDLPTGGAAQAGDAASPAGGRAAGPRARGAIHRANPLSALGDRARRLRPSLPPGDRRDHRARGGAALDALVSSCLGPAADDARSGSHRSARSCGRRAADRGDDRGDHGTSPSSPSRKARSRPPPPDRSWNHANASSTGPARFSRTTTWARSCGRARSSIRTSGTGTRRSSRSGSPRSTRNAGGRRCDRSSEANGATEWFRTSCFTFLPPTTRRDRSCGTQPPASKHPRCRRAA